MAGIPGPSSAGGATAPRPPESEVTPPATTLTVSGRFKQPEIVLFAEPSSKHSRVLVLKVLSPWLAILVSTTQTLNSAIHCEEDCKQRHCFVSLQTNLSFDYYSHDEQEELSAKVKQLQIVSCVYGRDTSAASIVLFPADIEFKRSVESAKSGVKMEAKVTDIFLHLSATTCNIFLDVADMIMKDGQVCFTMFSDVQQMFCHRQHERCNAVPSAQCNFTVINVGTGGDGGRDSTRNSASRPVAHAPHLSGSLAAAGTRSVRK